MAGDLPNGNTHVSPSMEETLNAEKPTDQGSFHESEDLNLDEHFSVKPLAHNTTRLFPFIQCSHVLMIADYSGEFSYWNFSMRIKQWIDDWIPHTNTEVRHFRPYLLHLANCGRTLKEHRMSRNSTEPSNLSHPHMSSLLYCRTYLLDMLPSFSLVYFSSTLRRTTSTSKGLGWKRP